MIELFNCHYNELFKMLPDKCIDIAICDIPYGIGAGKMAYTRELKTTVKVGDYDIKEMVNNLEK